MSTARPVKVWRDFTTKAPGIVFPWTPLRDRSSVTIYIFGVFLTYSDYMYTLRYMVKTMRFDDSPWSDRKMGIYHKYDGTRSIWIVLQPHRVALDLPRTVAGNNWKGVYHILPHLSLFTSTLNGWTEYLNFLEGLIIKNVSWLATHGYRI